MRKEKYLPAAVICLSFGSSAAYFCVGDWRRGLYWFAAGLISLSVIL